MKTVLLIILAAVSLATSACTTTYEQGYSYSSYSSPSYYSPQPAYVACHQEEVYISRPSPSYYRTNVPYYRGNIINRTGVPIIAPSATSNLNVIIPNSWN